MATLSDLKTRVQTELNRDDLADDLADSLTLSIQQSIDYYAPQRFWFNEKRTTSTMTIGDEYVDLPTGLRFIDKVFLVVGNVRYRMVERQMTEIEALYTTPIRGQPTDFAVFGTQIRTWPTANLGYTLIWEYVGDVTALDYNDPNSTNYWTTQGYDLITARTKIYLLRDYLSAMETDPRYQLALAQEDSAYSRLKAETNRRISTGKIKARW